MLVSSEKSNTSKYYGIPISSNCAFPGSDCADFRYEVITTTTDVIMVMEYAGEELFNYIVAKGKGGVSHQTTRIDDD